MKSRAIVTDKTGRVQSEKTHARSGVAIYRQPVDQEGFREISHWHPEAQFSIVTKGSVVFTAEDREYELKEGQVIFFNSGAVHQARPGSAFQENGYLCVKFFPDMLFGQSDPYIRSHFVDTILQAGHLRAVPFDQGAKALKACSLLKQLLAVYREKSFGYELSMRIILMQLWQEVFEAVSGTLNDFSVSSYSDKQRGEILQDYISRNYAEKITLEDISRAAHISRGECCRIFKRLHHTTPFQYLIHFRLMQSIQLLCGSDASISQIAQQVGFGSSSYYTECFKKEMHCTPLKYRQSNQNTQAMRCVI